MAKHTETECLDVLSRLSEGEQAILSRLESRPLGLYWGRNGWVPESLPKAARRKDFDSLRSRNPALVKIELGQMVAVKPDPVERQTSDSKACAIGTVGKAEEPAMSTHEVLPVLAAYRDASWLNRPDTRTPKRGHVLRANGQAACGLVAMMGDPEPAECVPELLRCKRPGCRDKWPPA